MTANAIRPSAGPTPCLYRPMIRDTVIAGALTSVVAALIMAVVMMVVFTVFLGKSPAYPVQVIGSTIYGENALIGFNGAAFLAGLILHMGVGLAWGLVFGLFAGMKDTRTPAQAAILGLGVAALSMVDSYIFVPLVMNALHGVDIWNREVPILWNWAAHAVFGLSFAFYPAILEKCVARTRRQGRCQTNMTRQI